jgi:hypothetical protein
MPWPCVPVNVGQRLLNDSKEHGLGVEGQPSEALGQVQIHLDAAALGKPSRVPP